MHVLESFLESQLARERESRLILLPLRLAHGINSILRIASRVFPPRYGFKTDRASLLSSVHASDRREPLRDRSADCVRGIRVCSLDYSARIRSGRNVINVLCRSAAAAGRFRRDKLRCATYERSYREADGTRDLGIGRLEPTEMLAASQRTRGPRVPGPRVPGRDRAREPP